MADTRAPEPRRQAAGARLAAVAALIILAGDAFVLRWVGVSWSGQLVFSALVVLWGLAGLAFLARHGQVFSDRLGLLAKSVALGMAAHLAFAFVLLHRDLARALGLADLRAAVQLSLFALIPFSLSGFAKLQQAVADRRFTSSPAGAVVLLAGASMVALLSAFGYRDTPLPVSAPSVAEGEETAEPEVTPEWGSTQDRYQQFLDGTLAQRGFPKAFPHRVFQHRGVATAITVAGYLAGPFQPEAWMAISKPLSLLWLFLCAYGAYALARRRPIPEAAAVFAGLGALLFAALNPALLWAGEVSSYRICPVSGTLYHNVTQQASVALGLAGVGLAARALVGRRGLFAPGCALLAASLFCKPSLFSIAAPPLLLAAALRWRHLASRDLWAGCTWLLGIVAFWSVYPRLFGLSVLAAPIELGIFSWQRNTDLGLPWSVGDPAVLVISVVSLSYAAFALPILRALPIRFSKIAPDTLVLAAIGIVGVASGLLLVQTGSRAGQGNVMWGAAAGHLVLLPLLVRAIARVEPTGLRRAAWAVYVAHLASGAWNLWLFARSGLF